MRIAIATVQVPFLQGGAEYLVANLAASLRAAGHEVDTLAMPFRFGPPDEVLRSMDAWSRENLEAPNGVPIDRVVCVKFPSYYLQHPDKVVWLAHQHRTVYELWDSRHGDGSLCLDSEGWALRWRIREQDRRHLESCRRIFTISRRVSERLCFYNLLESQPLYHPPPLVPRYRSAKPEPIVFFPSRLEGHKRQDLLIESMKLVRSQVSAVLVGNGGLREALGDRIRTCGLEGKVRIAGRVSEDELIGYFARCLAVFFGPYDEDYGYVTLEAMLSSKPVITCTDSGGPLEFVIDGETGVVVPPNPEAIAAAIDRLAYAPSTAVRMGRAGHQLYQELGISWDSVVAQLTS